MKPLGIGIVGTGSIAGVVATAIRSASNAKLVGASSRSLERAEAFAGEHGAAVAAQGHRDLISSPVVEAVYVATPTAAEEPIVLDALRAGKHVLADKPFVSAASAVTMASQAESLGLVLMDATHFVHHPRTAAVLDAIPERVGEPLALHASFFAPFDDRSNIRFDPELEPMGAVGDLGWYTARAVIEYLQPTEPVRRVHAVANRDAQTGAVVRAAGVIEFGDSRTLTFEFGFEGGTFASELRLMGTRGQLSIDDFVIDFGALMYDEAERRDAGYSVRSGWGGRPTGEFLEVSTDRPADVRMVEAFAALARDGTEERRAAWRTSLVETQRLVDRIMGAC
ncbi:MAG: Gfo/Idh/MocA family oxidoreductase [Planctomycetota bacterium]